MSVDRPERPAWSPGARARRCNQCGAHVPGHVARVMGDENNEIHACERCDPDHWKHGHAAGIDTYASPEVSR